MSKKILTNSTIIKKLKHDLWQRALRQKSTGLEVGILNNKYTVNSTYLELSWDREKSSRTVDCNYNL